MIIRKPYLIQRGKFRTKYEKIDKNNIPIVSEFIVLDSMGSAEFEFGSLPISLRKVHKNRFDYTANKVMVGDMDLTVIHPKGVDINEYRELLVKIKSYEIICKEWVFTNFKDLHINFWWDLNNNIFFSTKKEIVWIMDSVCASIKYMDKAKAA